jgi:hypothetical protein
MRQRAHAQGNKTRLLEIDASADNLRLTITSKVGLKKYWV